MNCFVFFMNAFITTMKKYQLVFLAVFAGAIASCKEDDADPAVLTGESVSYPLFSGAEEWGYEGEAVFAERADGFTLITISLSGPAGTSLFPAHLHEGAYSHEADMAAMLNPVDAATGKSETLLKQLANGEPVGYSGLIVFNGHIKVHLGDGDDKNVILAYGNIGSNPATANRANLADCVSW